MTSGAYEENGSLTQSLGSPIVFLHDETTLPKMGDIRKSVGGLDHYDRVLPIADRCDAVVLKHQPDSNYVSWLRSVGMGTNKILVLEGNTDVPLQKRVLRPGVKAALELKLGNTTDHATLSTYYGGRPEETAANYLGFSLYANPEQVLYADSKVNFRELCIAAEVPVVPTERVVEYAAGRTQLEQVLDECSQETGSVIVRGEFGSSGATTHVFKNYDAKKHEGKLNAILASSEPSDRFLIAPFYEIESSPSSVWFIKRNGELVHLRTSNQILDQGILHEGNEYSANDWNVQINAEAFKIVHMLAERGYTGPLGIDFLTIDGYLYATECNPRITGAMYPWEVVKKLERKHGVVGAAHAENIHLPRKGCKFQDIWRVWHKYMYNGRQHEGIIFPFNMGPVGDGKVSVVGTGQTLAQVHALFNTIKEEVKKM